MQRLYRAALAVLAVTTIIATTACNDASIDTPTTSSEPTAPVASAPTPAASPTPNPAPTPGAGEGEEPQPDWAVECSATGQMTVKYNGGASYADVLTYYTSFDGPQHFGEEIKRNLPKGEQFTRTFPACSQSDAEPLSGRPAGHCYFDKNGVPFNEKRNPEKVTECRTTPCVPEWRRSEEYEVIYGPYSGPGESSAQSFTVQAEEEFKCGTRTVTYRYTETNSCTRETRNVDVKQEDQYTPCEVSCEQRYPNPGDVNGSGSKTVTKHNGTPTYYWYDGEDSGIQNDCESEGGTFYSSVNIPNDGSGSNKSNVCKTTVNHGSYWEYDNSDYASKEATEQGTPDKYSVSVGAGFSVASGAGGSYTFEIVWNGSTVKKSTSKSLECGESFQGTLTWAQGDQYNNSPNYDDNDGHVTGSYALRVKRNGSQVPGSPFALP